MKNTILNRKDTLLLEDVILRYGRIASFNQLKEIFKKEYSAIEVKKRVSILTKAGWLFRIKKGLYVVITDIGSLNTNNVSEYDIISALNKDSYVSFENALQYHGVFDQMLSTVSAITFKRARRYKMRNVEIKFFKISGNLYFGFSGERGDVGIVNIAKKEKAILDILYFRSNEYYAGLVWQKLNEYKNDFDFNLLKEYASKFNYDVIRQIGFFLDKLDISTNDLYKLISGKTSYSKMTKDSKVFNSKWRLYFDDKIVR
ncbi:MAG: hypothetical protein ABH873_09140 [Candidatus Firestonebacteria bacterium]